MLSEGDICTVNKLTRGELLFPYLETIISSCLNELLFPYLGTEIGPSLNINIVVFNR